jgi:cyclin D1/2/4, plant
MLRYVLQERLSQCLEAVQSMALTTTVLPPLPSKSEVYLSRASSSSVPQSPTGVLDAGCLSYRSDDTTVAPHAICCIDERESSPAVSSKRRKISR